MTHAVRANLAASHLQGLSHQCSIDCTHHTQHPRVPAQTSRAPRTRRWRCSRRSGRGAAGAAAPAPWRKPWRKPSPFPARGSWLARREEEGQAARRSSQPGLLKPSSSFGCMWKGAAARLVRHAHRPFAAPRTLVALVQHDGPVKGGPAQPGHQLRQAALGDEGGVGPAGRRNIGWYR